MLKITNPATGECIDEIDEIGRINGISEIELAFRRATEGQLIWRARPFYERLQSFERFHGLLGDRCDYLAKRLTKETGKPITQSYAEIDSARKRISFFLENSGQWLASEDIRTIDGIRERLVYEPLGVIANISAWNYPYLVGVNVYVPALIAGNAVLYKPSEYATLSGIAMGELLYEAGVPGDVFQVLVGGPSVGKALLALPLNGYFFTGSVAVGAAIATAAAPKLVPMQLELGGKDPAYVTADVDVNVAAATTADAAFYNNGQSCCAIERLYVEASIYEKFVDAFSEIVFGFKVGDPTDSQTFIGAITRASHLCVLKAQVDDALAKGATLICGGSVLNRPGTFFRPTILTDVDHTMDVMINETFGPIIGIMKVENDEQAIRLMNDTKFGLTAGVFSRDQSRAESILSTLDVGTAYWNCADRVSPYLTWSGRRQSGLGSTLSFSGIRVFVQPKAYHLRGG